MASLIGATAPYGVKAIRQIRASNTTGLPPQPTARQIKRKQEVMEFFRMKVDPILGDCITHLLLKQPDDVLPEMISFLSSWDGAQIENIKTEHMTSLKPRKEMKLYLASSIGPVVAKLANRVAVTRPENVKEFMVQELHNMEREEHLVPDKNSAHQFHSQHTASSSSAAHHTQSSASVMAETKPAVVTAKPAEATRTMQLAVFGVNNAGKSTIVNMLQGKLDPKMKPTVGFRPLSMSLGDDMKVKFYDLGGGKRIRDIWSQYYHDVHGIIYVIDSSIASDGDALKETIEVFQQTLSSSYLKGKPLLILANKQDLPHAKSANSWQTLLPIPLEYHDKLIISGCSSYIPEDVNPETYQPDPSIEAAIDGLCSSVLAHYDHLQERVRQDSAVKAQEEARKRIEKERRVLRNKIATAFVEQVSPAYVAEHQIEADRNNLFDEEEGINFITGEIGEEPNAVGRQVAAMVGYQRLALQIVGALKAPISKKKQPMSWEEIHVLVSELREELGLPRM